MHGSREVRVEEIVHWSSDFLDELYWANAIAGTSPPLKELISALWRPPDPGLYKVMAFSAQPVLAGYSPIVAEALAIFKGLQFARDTGLVPCCIESDAQVVVNLINSNNVPLTDVGIILADCKLLLEASPGCCVGFASRLANKAAHGLAKLGLSLETNCFWMEDYLSNVASIVLGDRPDQV
ncbi:hypothetical protein Dsin_003462 [Dipteronia sinensis]|uniref:RNase H type-1 domain-containing protein n=1 Tax=Dipteronia sinensis TaxID=43782 RepID=A0AAE0B7Q3_9ROSI|nr:hypothetical protein Dsin_003462 [Dipteronia sinensis]